MRVTNTHGADVTAGGVTIAPGATEDAEINQDHPFVKAGWLKPVGDVPQDDAGGTGGDDDGKFTAQHKGGGKWIIIDPEGQEVPEVSGTKDEIAEQVATLNEELEDE